MKVASQLNPQDLLLAGTIGLSARECSCIGGFSMVR